LVVLQQRQILILGQLFFAMKGRIGNRQRKNDNLNCHNDYIEEKVAVRIHKSIPMIAHYPIPINFASHKFKALSFKEASGSIFLSLYLECFFHIEKFCLYSIYSIYAIGSGLLTWLHNNQLIEIHNPLYKPTEVFFSILRDHWDDLVNIGLSSLLEIAVNPSGKEKLYLHNES
ncbi:hypothetical protein ACJX0J_000059, partial (mitochondrion) [Zea mays]